MKGLALAEWDRSEAYEFRVSPLDSYLLRYRWYVNRGGYIYRRGTTGRSGVDRRSVNVYLHREIMGLEYGDGLEVDHLDGDPANCRRQNLEVVSRLENERRKRNRLKVGVATVA